MRIKITNVASYNSYKLQHKAYQEAIEEIFQEMVNKN
jgi:hypothetical protein